MSRRNGHNNLASMQVMSLKMMIAGKISVKTRMHICPTTLTLDQLVRKASKAGISITLSFA